MASIKISELNPAGSNLSKDSESFMNVLSGKEVANIQGGWVGVAGLGLGAAALGWSIYEGYTTREQRIVHSKAIKTGLKIALTS